MTERSISPSKITAWLDCAHYLTLRHQVDDGLRAAPQTGLGSFAELLMDKGRTHEEACLAAYEARGLHVRRVPERDPHESFAAWTARVGDVLADGCWDVLYQVPLVHDGVRGIADFLLRVQGEDGTVTWEPVDAKLARQEAKPGHVLQLCFYAEAITARTGRRPERMHLRLGSGEVETLRVGDFAAYWRRLRGRLRGRLVDVLEAPAAAAGSVPQPCEHCGFCEFSADCEAQWRKDDALVFVAGIRARERAAFEDAGVASLAALAERTAPVDGVPVLRQERLVVQASLQRQAREQDVQHPPHLLVQPGEDPVWGRGLEQLPAPDHGDVFLDFEGHPFWRADAGLFFLFGLIAREAGVWRYRAWWAHDRDQEGRATGELIAYLAARRPEHPAMHVYHYNHTERSSLETLAAQHGVGEVALATLVETGAFVDLLQVARNAVQVGGESYGLKSLERLTDYARGHEVDQGSGAVLEYERWMTAGDQDALQRIAAYNEDDVRATRAVRDWLLARRADDLSWREAVLRPADELPELDEQVERLHAFGPGTSQHLLGDVLGYWRREWKAHLAPLLARCTADEPDLLQDPEALAGLVPLGLQERSKQDGNPARPLLRCALPEQDTSRLKAGDQVVFLGPDGAPGYSSVARLDRDAGEVDLVWSEDVPRGPKVLVRNGWVAPRPKPAALSELAAQVLGDGGASPAALALLRRDLPSFEPGAGPAGGVFTDDLDEMLAWTAEVDGTCVAVQGPPGTGKTYRGARQVKALLDRKLRVGITAFSHHAIDNLLEAVVALYADDPDALQAVRKVTRKPADGLPGVTYVTSNPAAAKQTHSLVAGTTWLFAGDDMAAAPVDVLVVDEAGQLSLADTLAACRSAQNVLLLGDPLQLPQVQQAAHPGGSGRSALEHLLGDVATMPPDRGVFLTETRRMHPDVCTFISEHVYEGRLTSHESCAQQSTVLGTGLRRLRATHTGCSTSAEQEAELVGAELDRLLGTPWVDQHGAVRPLSAQDVLVVAPYNDQVDLLRTRLVADPRTAGVAVGTVDKFQGRQAAVVFFTMATSSAADMTRSGEFLFSRNRFNVAVSRARCLAYLVCTDELLDSRGRDLEEMRLLSTLCAFAEAAELPVVPHQAGPHIQEEPVFAGPIGDLP